VIVVPPRARVLALSLAMAVVDAAPLLADRRPRITHVAKAAAEPADETPLPTVATVQEVVALYRAVGRALRDLAARDPEASARLLPRYRHLRILDAVDPRKRRVIELRLVELRGELAKHAN
jgi:hypothetical protein